MSVLSKPVSIHYGSRIQASTSTTTITNVTTPVDDLKIDPRIWYSTINEPDLEHLRYLGTSISDRRKRNVPKYVMEGMLHKRAERERLLHPFELTSPPFLPGRECYVTLESTPVSTPSPQSLNPLAASFQTQRNLINGQVDHSLRRDEYFPICRTPSPYTALPPRANSLSTDYLGDPSDPLNSSADIPQRDSVSLWVDRLPPHCTAACVLARIRGCGKVFSLHINPPRGPIATSAAKLHFWTVAGKVNFLRLVARGGFAFGPRRPRVTHSKICVPEQPAAPRSRVLHVAGPAPVVNRGFLERLFDSNFVWLTDCVIDHGGRDGEREKEGEEKEERAWIEYRFSSYRAQASRAFQLLDGIKKGRRECQASESERDMLTRVELWWGVDPCA